MFFPQMASLCNSAKGDALLLLTRNADVFAARLPRDPVTRVIVPLLCRAADQGACLASHVLHPRSLLCAVPEGERGNVYSHDLEQAEVTS